MREVRRLHVTFTGADDFRDPMVLEQHVQDWTRSLLPTVPADQDLTCEAAFGIIDHLPAAVFRELPPAS